MFTPDAPHPDATLLEHLCDDLGDRAPETAEIGPWRSGAFDLLARHGVLRGFIPAADGGSGAAEAALIEALTAISSRCLTTALVLTQWASGCRIIAGADGPVRRAWLPDLARGAATTTVGIAQLSTSRRHLDAPALLARPTSAGWRLNGLCPWVTGADSADTIVSGALTEAGKQLFFIVPTRAQGVEITPPMRLLALAGSRTSSVAFADVCPAAVIEPRATGGVRTGGLATTALALGSARAALNLLDQESAAREGLRPVAAAFRVEAADIAARARHAATSFIAEDRDQLRADANSLAIRAAQAALTATKGTGFIAGHLAERLVREAHFFLVWSCPQAVAGITLCELAHAEI